MTENDQKHPETIITNNPHIAIAKPDPVSAAVEPQHVEPSHVAAVEAQYQAAAGLVPVSVAVTEHDQVALTTTVAVPVQDTDPGAVAVSGPLTGATTVPDPATLAVATAAPEDAAAVIASVAAVNAVSAVPVSQVQVQPMDTTTAAAAAQMVSVGSVGLPVASVVPPVSAAYAMHQPVPSAQIPTGHLAPQMLAPNMHVNMGAVNVNVQQAGLMPKDTLNNGNMNVNMNVNSTGRSNMAMPVNNIPVQSPITKRKSSAPFVCEVVGCGKSFGKKFNLKAHRRVHTGEEPFRCSYPTCGKTFKWKSSLTFHEGLHLNVPDDPQPIPEQTVAVAAAPGTTNHAAVPGLGDDNKGKQEGKVQ